MTRIISMSTKELNKVEVIGELVQGSINQKQAADALGVSDRQIRRVTKKSFYVNCCFVFLR